VSALTRDIDNLRAAVDYGLATDDAQLVRKITASLPVYWMLRGQYTEGRAWTERALGLDAVEDDIRRRLLSALGSLAYAQGDHVAAIAASDEAANLAARLGGATERLDLLREQALAALRKGELDDAERLFVERLEVAIAVDNGVGTSSCRLNLTSIANARGRHARAEELLAENLPFVRSRGQARCEAYTLVGLAETALHVGRIDERLAEAVLGATRALQIDDRPLAAYSLDLVAAAVAGRDADIAAVILGATEAAREAMGVECDEDEEAIRAVALAQLGHGPSPDAWRRGRALDLAAALPLVRDLD
jgi:non-specific serine/threonine protein kinase